MCILAGNIEVTCDPIHGNVGEIYGDLNCTTDRKRYGDTCVVTCASGYELTETTMYTYVHIMAIGVTGSSVNVQQSTI